MRIVKRIICVVLSAACVFFTGCNSIIYNGDFRFQSFEPETLPPVFDLNEQVGARIQAVTEEDQERKYDIEGRDAFYILPDHESEPEKIIDFKVLDYTDQGDFIYAYRTPYYGEQASGVLAVQGTAPQKTEDATEKETEEAAGKETEGAGEKGPEGTAEKDTGNDVLVLMSYNPWTRAYKVFYSCILDGGRNKADGADQAETGNSAEKSRVMASRLVRNRQYFIFSGTTAYVYDDQGRELYRNDFGTLISQEASRLKQKAASRGGEKAAELLAKAEVTISDVVMDGMWYVYIPITVELPMEEEGEGDDGNLEENEVVENTTFTTIVACYDLDMGGRDSAVGFYSQNTAWEDQVRCWQTLNTEDANTDEEGIFHSLEDLERYMELYTMDNIKAGLAGKVPDRFSPFRTTNNTLNMELAGVPSLFSSTLYRMSQSNQVKGSCQLTLGQLLEANDWSWKNLRNRWLFYLGIWAAWEGRYQPEIFWRYFDENQRKEMGGAAKESLALLAQGDQGIKNRLNLGMDPGDYLLIPWLAPGNWQQDQNVNQEPFAGQTADGLEAVYAYKTSIYEGAGGRQAVSRYADIELPGQYQSPSHSRPAMEVTARSEEGDLAPVREFSYYETVGQLGEPVREEAGDGESGSDDGQETSGSQPGDSGEAEGDGGPGDFGGGEDSEGESGGSEGGGDSSVQRVVKTIQETLAPYPTGYRLIFPEGTKVNWIEEVDTGEMVAASGELGGIYYTEMEQTEEEADNQEPVKSRIRYNNGRDILWDQNVPGRAVDVGMLYDSNEDPAGGEGTEVVFYVTDEGIKFYRAKNPDGTFDVGAGLFLTLDKLSSPVKSYGVSHYGQETLTGEKTEGQLWVSQEQEDMIREKTEKGRASDTYGADQFCLLNKDQVVVSSLSEGIMLVNLNNGLAISLKSGAYYRAFPYKEADEGGSVSRKFMVVGYDTEEYVYQSSDISRAKCYSMDLDETQRALEGQAMRDHLDSLANGYLDRTHRLSWSQGEGVDKAGSYKILEPDQEEKEADRQARVLFYGSEEDQDLELEHIASQMGFSRISEDTRTYGRWLREKLLDQRKAVREIYELAGLGPGIPFPAQDAELLEKEGLLISAAYEKTLENLLVDLRLSDQAIGNMEPARRQEYRKYQQERQAAKALNDRESQYQDQQKAQDALEKPWDPNMKTEKELASMENMACYETVLGDIRQSFLDQGEDSQWEPYLKDLLGRVSPDSVVNKQEQGLEQFYELTGFSPEIVDRESLLQKLSAMSRIREIEELIVEEKLKTAGYQTSPFREEFKNYQETVFETEEGRRKAFRSAEFYQVIKEMREPLDRAEKKTGRGGWEETLSEILGKCGVGLVLDMDTEKVKKKSEP